MRNWPVKMDPKARLLRSTCVAAGCCVGLLAWTVTTLGGADRPGPSNLAGDYAGQVRPLMSQYCLTCHSTQKKKGDLDLERFASLEQVRKDLRPWQGVLEMLENGEMPPKGKPQPPLAERRRFVVWVRAMLDAEARARAGDPGRV